MKAALLLVACCLALALVPHAAAQAMAQLSGEKQASVVPAPVNTMASGSWNATLEGNRMAWTLEVAGANQCTMAHIHQGDAKTNGPVIVFLVPVGVGSAPTTQSLPMLEPPQSGDLSFQGSFTAADFGGPAAGKSMQDLINMFQTGQAYVNVHTVSRPAGEIRGQVEWM